MRLNNGDVICSKKKAKQGTFIKKHLKLQNQENGNT